MSREKKIDKVKHCGCEYGLFINPQNFIHRRRYRDEYGKWVEVEKGGE